MNILWIPHAAWRTPQRAKTFCEKLSERHEVHVTDYDAEFSSLTDYMSMRYIKNYFYRKSQDINITVHHIPRISPVLFSKTLREINYGIFSKYVQRIIEEYDIDSVVGTFVCKPPEARHLVFDLFDDNPELWRDSVRFKSYADEIEAIENEYIGKANEIVAVSSVLAEKVGKKNAHLIPNGVDIKKFRNANGEKVRNELDLDGVVVGYVALFAEFTGLTRLIKASERLDRDIKYLIVGDGPLLPPAKKYVEKKNINNFIFTGFVNPGDVADYYKAIDIGVYPCDKTRFTDAASPIKVLEYTAADKSVVCTDLEEIKRMEFSNVILVKDNSESLAEGIEKAINTKVKIPEKIKDYDINKLAMEYERVLEK